MSFFMLVKINNFIISCIVVFIPFFPITIHASPDINYIIKDDSILNSRNDLTGDPYKGRELVRDRNKGNCLACHQLPIPEDAFHGTIGPSLHKISLRLTEAQIRLRVTDMKQINPISIMPGYFRSPEKITRISPLYENCTILSAQEVEDIVSYLVTLKSDPFESPL